MNADWFGGRLRELREGAGLTQQELAERAGLTREGIAQLETGRREPAWRTVVALCQALGARADDFLQAPAPRPESKPGRPRKVAVEPSVLDRDATVAEQDKGKKRKQVRDTEGKVEPKRT